MSRTKTPGILAQEIRLGSYLFDEARQCPLKVKGVSRDSTGSVAFTFTYLDDMTDKRVVKYGKGNFSQLSRTSRTEARQFVEARVSTLKGAPAEGGASKPVRKLLGRLEQLLRYFDSHPHQPA